MRQIRVELAVEFGLVREIVQGAIDLDPRMRVIEPRASADGGEGQGDADVLIVDAAKHLTGEHSVDRVRLLAVQGSDDRLTLYEMRPLGPVTDASQLADTIRWLAGPTPPI
jgi:hypothetical protein